MQRLLSVKLAKNPLPLHHKVHGFLSNPILSRHFSLGSTLLRVSSKKLSDCRLAFLQSKFPKQSLNSNPVRIYNQSAWKSWFRRLSSNDMVLGLIVANVAVFLLWRIANPLFMYKNFTLSLSNFTSGRLHTLITSAFSHIDAGHIISNMIGLYFFGISLIDRINMGSSFAQALSAILLMASMVAISTANKDWQQRNYTGWGFNHGPYHLNKTNEPSKIVVGGSENWHYGFNYADWSLKNSFYVQDTLVFKYDPPSNSTPPHSVYMLPNLWSFIHCDLSQARLVGSPTQGGGDGVEFVLKSWQPYYFACGEHNGTHCKEGMMRFFVFPKLRGY